MTRPAAPIGRRTTREIAAMAEIAAFRRSRLAALLAAVALAHAAGPAAAAVQLAGSAHVETAALPDGPDADMPRALRDAEDAPDRFWDESMVSLEVMAEDQIAMRRWMRGLPPSAQASWEARLDSLADRVAALAAELETIEIPSGPGFETEWAVFKTRTDMALTALENAHDAAFVALNDALSPGY